MSKKSRSYDRVQIFFELINQSQNIFNEKHNTMFSAKQMDDNHQKYVLKSTSVVFAVVWKELFSCRSERAGWNLIYILFTEVSKAVEILTIYYFWYI